MIKLKTIAELVERSLARLIYPVADKKGIVTLRTIKVENVPMIEKHNPEEGIIQYNISLPLEAVDAERYFNVADHIQQLINAILLIYSVGKDVIPLVSYIPEKRLKKFNTSVCQYGPFNVRLTILPDDTGREYLMIDITVAGEK